MMKMVMERKRVDNHCNEMMTMDERENDGNQIERKRVDDEG